MTEPNTAIPIAEESINELIAEEFVGRFNADLTKAVKEGTTNRETLRFMVGFYEEIQRVRLSLAGHARHQETTQLLTLTGSALHTIEKNLQKAFLWFCRADELSSWALSMKGVGPVIAAGLAAHIEPENVRTVGQIYSFAGLNPEAKWEKKSKRPWNAALKKLCWQLGESFLKVSNRGSFYGHKYRVRRAYEDEKNAAGDYSEQAKAKLERFNIGKKSEAYKYYSRGQLPPAHMNRRSLRWAVKLFLSHWWEMHCELSGHELPVPFAIAHKKHVKFISVHEAIEYENDQA